MAPIKIGISENHFFIRQGLVSYLKTETNFKIMFETSQEESLLEELKKQHPDVVFLGIHAHSAESVSTLKIIKNKCPNTRVIILSAGCNNNVITNLVSAGISGFLLNTCDHVTLMDAVYRVCNKERYFDPKITELMISNICDKDKTESGHYKISERQKEILRLLYEEKSSDEIASILFLSRRTVEWHKNKIFEKVGCKSAIGAIKFAIHNGIITA